MVILTGNNVFAQLKADFTIDKAGGCSPLSVQFINTTTNAGHLPTSAVNGSAAPDLKYRVPLAPSLDGNTVDVQMEQAAFAENSVRSGYREVA